ncbi:hypothetical protein M5362_01050 [Streptomyces sp. Je 1-79]|uniref:hypothetical protein n=1 Tax=Streptomyces sp. Je 1-79 TaxID=2943847 RepID=UPI0021A7FD67|nr:hypothetical protein [Streptomyces sp. Je 1-79]MCT4351720.1 hypothetical protein [Streptomyces sp. Je 1-79]
MTPHPALTTADSRSSRRRSRLALAATALAALAVSGCGTVGADAAGSDAKPAAVGAQRTEAPRDVDGEAAFTAMWKTVAEPCPTGDRPLPPPPEPLPAPPGASDTPSTDAPVTPIAPTAGPEVELSARDWCASNLHEERITHALMDLAEPTPDTVRKILNALGYNNGRIHGMERSGTTTRFFLDLRVDGGRLCVEGSAAGGQTVVERCVAPESGPFRPGERKQ